MSGWKVGRGTVKFRGSTYTQGKTIPDAEFVRAFPDEAQRLSRIGTMRRMYGLERVEKKPSQRSKSNGRTEVQAPDPGAGIP